MTRITSSSCLFAVLSLAGLGLGCADTNTTEVQPTPATVLTPTAPDETPPAPASKDAAASPGDETPSEPAPEDATAPPDEAAAPAPASAIKPIDLAAAEAPRPAAADQDDVTLTPVKYDELISRIAANKGVKFTLVDIWATWCPPCMENFPHVVAMHSKFAGQGLAVASLSFDDTADPAALKEAEKFLKEKKAVFPNFVLDEPQDVAFEKFDMIAIPAVFLFGPDGKELKRYTWDDPNNQFTYDQVENDVAALLQGEPVPREAGVKPDAPKPEATKAEAPKD